MKIRYIFFSKIKEIKIASDFIKRNPQRIINIHRNAGSDFFKLSKNENNLGCSFYLFFNPEKRKYKAFIRNKHKPSLAKGTYKIIYEAIDITNLKVVALAKTKFSPKVSCLPKLIKNEEAILPFFNKNPLILSTKYYGQIKKNSTYRIQYLFLPYYEGGDLGKPNIELGLEDKYQIGVDIIRSI